jgi:hypothetical protein
VLETNWCGCAPRRRRFCGRTALCALPQVPRAPVSLLPLSRRTTAPLHAPPTRTRARQALLPWVWGVVHPGNLLCGRLLHQRGPVLLHIPSGACAAASVSLEGGGGGAGRVGIDSTPPPPPPPPPACACAHTVLHTPVYLCCTPHAIRQLIRSPPPPVPCVRSPCAAVLAPSHGLRLPAGRCVGRWKAGVHGPRAPTAHLVVRAFPRMSFPLPQAHVSAVWAHARGCVLTCTAYPPIHLPARACVCVCVCVCVCMLVWMWRRLPAWLASAALRVVCAWFSLPLPQRRRADRGAPAPAPLRPRVPAPAGIPAGGTHAGVPGGPVARRASWSQAPGTGT